MVGRRKVEGKLHGFQTILIISFTEKVMLVGCKCII